jgi:hypothetical protein
MPAVENGSYEFYSSATPRPVLESLHAFRGVALPEVRSKVLPFVKGVESCICHESLIRRLHAITDLGPADRLRYCTRVERADRFFEMRSSATMLTFIEEFGWSQPVYPQHGRSSADVFS